MVDDLSRDLPSRSLPHPMLFHYHYGMDSYVVGTKREQKRSMLDIYELQKYTHIMWIKTYLVSEVIRNIEVVDNTQIP